MFFLLFFSLLVGQIIFVSFSPWFSFISFEHFLIIHFCLLFYSGNYVRCFCFFFLASPLLRDVLHQRPPPLDVSQLAEVRDALEKTGIKIYEFFLSSRVLGCRVHHPFRDPWRIFATWRRGIGEMSSKVGGAAPGFEPGTSCMRVRSRSHYATGAAPYE